jgi:galactokinase
LFLINTGVQHELTTTDYNTRASECSQALALLRKTLGLETMRQVMGLDHDALAAVLPPILLRRVLFVQREHQRVREAVSALEQKDWNRLGQLLYDSHAGLRDDYEVSCAELDFLVNYSDGADNILGARMMGGGFGGCTINLAFHPPNQ